MPQSFQKANDKCADKYSLFSFCFLNLNIYREIVTPIFKITEDNFNAPRKNEFASFYCSMKCKT